MGGEIVPECFELDRGAAVPVRPQQPDHFAEQSDRASRSSDMFERGSDHGDELVGVRPISTHQFGEGGGGGERQVTAARGQRFG